MGVEDDDLSDLERRMREKLRTGEGVLKPHTLSPHELRIARKLIGEGRQNAHSFTDEEQRIAERLVGITNAKRITTAKEGRRVRPLPPPLVHYEYYWIPGDWMNGRHWRINRVENGRQREQHKMGHLDDDLFEELKELEAKGHRIVDGSLNRAPSRPKQPTISKRKAIINSLRFYRP